MNPLSSLRQTAEVVKTLGPLTASVRRLACARPGQCSIAAMLEIKTSVARPQNVGGGVVQWHGYVDAGANPDHIDALNRLLALVMAVVNDIGPVMAAVANAFEAADAARQGQRDAEQRLRRVLKGDSYAHGALYVTIDAKGQAWLMDPVKRGGGFGFCWPSLAELWHAHPELRPVRWGSDADGPFLIVEPMAMESRP